MKKRLPLEKALQAHVLTWLRHNGGWWANCSPSVYSKAGVPDIIGCYHGRFIAFELKRPQQYANPNDGLTIIQTEVGDAIRRANGVWVCTDDLDIVKATLQHVRQESRNAPC